MANSRIIQTQTWNHFLCAGNTPEEDVRRDAETELEAQLFLADVFEDRRKNPKEDLMSALVHAHGDDEKALSMHELQNLMHDAV